MATEAASLESSIAPRSDSSASRLCGGTRARHARGAGAARSGRGRVSSKAWTTVPLLCPAPAVGTIRATTGDWTKPAMRCGQAGSITCGGAGSVVTQPPSSYKGVTAGADPPGLRPQASGRDLDCDHGHDVREQLDGHLESARPLDVLGQEHVPAVDLDSLVRPGWPRRRRPGRSSRRACPPPPARAEIGMTAPARIVGLASASPRLLGLAQVPAPAHLLRLALHPVGGHDGPALGQEEVAGEAAGDLDDVAAPAHAVDVVTKQDLHQSSPSAEAPTTAPLSARSDEPASASAAPHRRHGAAVGAAAIEGRDVAQDLHVASRSRGASAPMVSLNVRSARSPRSPRSPRSRPPAAPAGTLGHRPLGVRAAGRAPGPS